MKQYDTLDHAIRDLEIEAYRLIQNDSLEQRPHLGLLRGVLRARAARLLALADGVERVLTP